MKDYSFLLFIVSMFLLSSEWSFDFKEMKFSGGGQTIQEQKVKEEKPKDFDDGPKSTF